MQSPRQDKCPLDPSPVLRGYAPCLSSRQATQRALALGCASRFARCAAYCNGNDGTPQLNGEVALLPLTAVLQIATSSAIGSAPHAHTPTHPSVKAGELALLKLVGAVTV
jgi:hypothetical protein